VTPDPRAVFASRVAAGGTIRALGPVPRRRYRTLVEVLAMLATRGPRRWE